MVAKDIRSLAREFVFYLVLCVGTFLMARLISQYTGFDPKIGFLAFKQECIGIDHWRWAFYIHVFSSLLTLAAGFTQFSRDVLKNAPRLHRVIGKIYVIAVLFVNVPTGLVMAVYANGLLPSKIAFTILDGLWFYFTLRALIEIKRKNVQAHRRSMIRSYALTFSAVTLRLWKMTLSKLFVMDSLMLYQIDAWLGFVPNWIAAEWYLRRRQSP